MILVTAFQYDGSDLNRKAYNCAYRTKETPPTKNKKQTNKRKTKTLLSGDQLVLSFMTGNYSVSFCSIYFFSFSPHLEWGASISTWYLSVQKMTTESFPVEQLCANYPAEGHTDDFPVAFIFPGEIHSQGWLLAKYAECHKPAALRAPHPSWWEAVSNCAEHLCQLLFLGTPQASTQSAFREGAPLFSLALVSKKLLSSHMIIVMFVGSL